MTLKEFEEGLKEIKKDPHITDKSEVFIDIYRELVFCPTDGKGTTYFNVNRGIYCK